MFRTDPRKWSLLASCATMMLSALPAQAQSIPEPQPVQSTGEKPAAGEPFVQTPAEAEADPTATTASASAAGSEGPDIIVTGSQIRGVAPVGSNLVAVGQEDIVRNTGNTVMEVLKSTPQLVNNGPNPGSVNAANPARGDAINLHGIGSAATLVLFNGRRGPFMGTGGGYTDPSYNPTIALERVEIIADGASATYGADAVAGVVNFITRKNFDGVEVRVRGGLADAYKNYSASAIIGQRWSTGHAMVAAEYAGNTQLFGLDRDYIRSDLRDRGGRDYRGNQCAPGNIIVGGVSYAIPAGGVTPATANQLVPNTTNRCETYPATSFLPNFRRFSSTFYATQDITDNLHAFAEGFYSWRAYRQHYYALGSSNVLANLVVPQSNAYFVAPPGTNPTSVTVAYNFAQDFGGLFTGHGHENTLGLNGGLTLDVGKSWKIEATGTYGRDHTFHEADRIYVTALNAALASSNPATALNPFVAGSTNPAVIAGINSFVFNPSGLNKFSAAEVKADGPLFDLPAGKVRAAIGASRFHYSLVSPTLTGVKGQPRTGPVSVASRNVKSAFAELFVPVVDAGMNIPLVYSFDLSLAGRIDDYNDFGSTTNPKVGANWSPVRGLTLRGSYGTSFRAPSLSSIAPVAVGQGVTVQTFADPLSPTGQSTGFTVSRNGQDLQPETATTWSFGADLKPVQVPGLRASASYWNIDFVNQITGGSASQNLLSDPDQAFRLTRNPTAAQVSALLNSGLVVNGVVPPNVGFIFDMAPLNQGTTLASGIDFDLSYTLPRTNIGQFNAGIAASYYLTYKVRQGPTSVLQSRLNTIQNPAKLRSRGQIGWNYEAFDTAIFWNHISGYRNNLLTPVEHVKAWDTFDLHIAYDLGKALGFAGVRDGTSIALDASNLFDRDPPYVNTNGGFDPAAASVIGRLVTVALTLRF